MEKTIERLWQELIEKDDRTSPAEYPDMALVTFEEFRAALSVLSHPEPVAQEAVEPTYGDSGPIPGVDFGDEFDPAPSPEQGEDTREPVKCRHCLDGLGSYNCFCTGRSA